MALRSLHWRYGIHTETDPDRTSPRRIRMQNSFGLVLLILFGGGGLISILAVINLLFPLPVEATREALEVSLGRSLLIGLVNFVFVGLLDLLLLWLGQMAGRVAGGILVILGGAITVALGT